MAPVRVEVHDNNEFLFSSDEELRSNSPIAEQTSDQEDGEDPDGQYAFKRKRGCNYLKALETDLGNWPWCSPLEGGSGDRRYRFCLTSLSKPNSRCIGFARRRYGRGGRYESRTDESHVFTETFSLPIYSLLFDRAYTPLDPLWSELSRSSLSNGFPSSELLNEIKNEWLSLFAFLSSYLTTNLRFWLYRLHFRPRTPPHDPSNMCFSSENIETEYDSEGNVIPVVTITSLKEYIDENSVNSVTQPNGQHNDIDFESFNRHQEELIEMQKKQLERLRHNCEKDRVPGLETGPVNNKTGYSNNVCNCGHSSNSITSATTTQSLSSGKPSVKRQSSAESNNNWPLPASTLDSASAHFAVSVVRSASEVTHNRTNSTNANDLSKEVTQNCYSLNCDNKSEKSVGPMAATNATNVTNGPMTNEKESLRNSFNSELRLPSTPSHTTLSSLGITSNEEHDSNDIHNTHSPLVSALSTPTPCKLKYQNRSQKTNTSIPPTDVT